MIGTAFLGFFNIAQNGFYLIEQNQQKQEQNQQKQKQIQFNLFRSNQLNTLQGKRYYSTNKNFESNKCINNTELNSIKIYDLLLEYNKKLKNFPASSEKLSTPSTHIYYYLDLINEPVLILKNLEDEDFKTDPDTFKLIFELYICVYLIWIEPVIKYGYTPRILKSNYMVDFERKVHIAIKEYSINYYKKKEIIKSNNNDKSKEADWSLKNHSIKSNNNNNDKSEETDWSLKNHSVRFKNISKRLEDFILEKNIEPIYVYENLNNVSIHKNILTETRGLSGIYLILNKVTLDYYIGSASTNRINKKFANHLIHLTGSKVLKNAVKKYKLSEFAFLILEIYPEIITVENNKKLLDLEDFYLKSLLPNYNILTEAGSSFGYKHTELSRIKMKAKYSKDRRNRIGNLNRNKVFSNEIIELMREKALTRVKPIYSKQAKENLLSLK
jgi:group I intron endonuclease